MKLYYRIDPATLREKIKRVKQEFEMHEEIDEEDTFLTLDDESRIELVRASYDPNSDETAHVRVVINDESLRQFFDSVFGEPYRVK
ncbi:MAG: hypothetical protein ACTSYL_07655 [Candidatus Thorarchaeota archaeon]